jgi:hypothetical protein
LLCGAAFMRPASKVGQPIETAETPEILCLAKL